MYKYVSVEKEMLSSFFFGGIKRLSIVNSGENIFFFVRKKKKKRIFSVSSVPFRFSLLFVSFSYFGKHYLWTWKGRRATCPGKRVTDLSTLINAPERKEKKGTNFLQTKTILIFIFFYKEKKKSFFWRQNKISKDHTNFVSFLMWAFYLFFFAKKKQN